MKQHITIEQLNELSPYKKSEWFDWALKHGYARVKSTKNNHLGVQTDSEMDMPTIGQMIEFLRESDGGKYKLGHAIGKGLLEESTEFCDALFSAVKEVLEHED